MSRKKNLFEFADSKSNDNNVSEDDDNTFISKNQGIKNQDDLKGRHFAFVVYPDSAPADWIDQLQNTGLSFVVSPLHDKDVNPDGTPKKEHYHIIVSWSNTTTYKSAKALCNTLNCPIPQLLKSCTGMYRYLTHKDNPEKYQYKEQPKPYNGWIPPLDSVDISRIKNEIFNLIYMEDCTEYGELVIVCMKKGPEYFDVVSGHTFFFKAVCDSYRHDRIKNLSRWLLTLEDNDEKAKIMSRLKGFLPLHIMVDEDGTFINEDTGEVVSDDELNEELNREEK